MSNKQGIFVLDSCFFQRELLFAILLFNFVSTSLSAQNQLIDFEASFNSKNSIAINDTLILGDSLIVISKLRYYVGFESNNETNYTLIDYSDKEKTSAIVKRLNTDLSFKIGVDSTTNVSGALSGDLDPTQGMYWAWQSGYINFKLEGIYIYKGETIDFNYHLGGYLAPYLNVQKVELGQNNNKVNQTVNLDLYPFFTTTDISQNVMRPCNQAVQLMQIISNSFSIVD